MNRDIDRYAKDYEADYGFERWQVHYRRQALLTTLGQHFRGCVLEVGCGLEPLFLNAPVVDAWHVIEPSQRFGDCAEELAVASPHVRVHRGFLEETVPVLASACPGGFDLVVASGVLAEVPDPAHFLSAIRTLLRPKGRVYIDAANAHSLHRETAVAMGLLQHHTEPSARGRKLQQRTVYDKASLTRDLVAAGFTVEASGGILLKPFDHARMQRAMECGVLGETHLDAYAALGSQFPAMASELWLLAAIRSTE